VKKKKKQEMRIVIDEFHPSFSVHIQLQKFKTKILSFSILLYLFVLTRSFRSGGVLCLNGWEWLNLYVKYEKEEVNSEEEVGSMIACWVREKYMKG
jgi:hypothetical protein